VRDAWFALSDGAVRRDRPAAGVPRHAVQAELPAHMITPQARIVLAFFRRRSIFGASFFAALRYMQTSVSRPK